MLIHSRHVDVITILETKLTPKQKHPNYITSSPCALIGCIGQDVVSLHSYRDNIQHNRHTFDHQYTQHCPSNGQGTHLTTLNISQLQTGQCRPTQHVLSNYHIPIITTIYIFFFRVIKPHYSICLHISWHFRLTSEGHTKCMDVQVMGIVTYAWLFQEPDNTRCCVSVGSSFHLLHCSLL